MSSLCHVVRMKGEENTMMRDYVLPDFSSIKKGFCKVMKHQSFQYCHCEFLLQRHMCGAVHFYAAVIFLSTSLERRWSTVESIRQGSRSWGWPMSASPFLRFSFTLLTSESRRLASQRPSSTPSSRCQKVCVFCVVSLCSAQVGYCLIVKKIWFATLQL